MDLFQTICQNYPSTPSSNLYNITRIEAGESAKKFYKINNQYLLIDFEHSEENAQHFCNLTSWYCAPNYMFPKVLYSHENLVITEFTNGFTLEQLILNTVRYKVLDIQYKKCINWICDFSKTQCPHVKIDSWKDAMEFNKSKLLNLVRISAHDELIAKAEALIDELYEGPKVMTHNDFHVGNIMLDNTDCLNIIDYHDMSYNIEHYDIVSLLYNPKKYFNDAQIEGYLRYYWEKLCVGRDETYENFVWGIKKIAFLRLARSLEMRFCKLQRLGFDEKTHFEIARGLNHLEKLEKYVGLNITCSLRNLICESNLISVVLCAGKGTRMRTEMPKCSVPILDVPMIQYVSNVLMNIPCDKNIYVVGYKKDVMEQIIGECKNVNDYFVEQNPQLGTGHAVIQAVPLIPDGKIAIVIMGDMPVLTSGQIFGAIKQHKESGAVTSAISSKLSMENTSGKVVRDANGDFVKLVEVKDIDVLYSKEEAELIKKINEVSTGIFIFNSECLKKYLVKLDCENAQNEYYLTDIIKLQKTDGLKVGCIQINHVCEPTGANTPEEIQMIEKVFSM